MFDLYGTTQLMPTLRKGDVVILNNLSSHKGPGNLPVFNGVHP